MIYALVEVGKNTKIVMENKIQKLKRNLEFLGV
jgi:hypothetical protein